MKHISFFACSFTNVIFSIQEKEKNMIWAFIRLQYDNSTFLYISMCLVFENKVRTYSLFIESTVYTAFCYRFSLSIIGGSAV